MIQIDVTDNGTLKSAIAVFADFGDALRSDDIIDEASTIIISRIRRRFMQNTNADGSQWPVTKASKTRAAGGKTWAKGGPYAPGGWKVGGGILFASGNLFHSIQLARVSRTERKVMTDVPYAVFYQGQRGFEIIGASDEDMNLASAAILKRLKLT